MNGDYVILKKMLRLLESYFGFPGELDIKWQPDPYAKNEWGQLIDGKVQDGTIFIFTDSLDKAKETLIHEFIENCLLREFLDPYNDIVNSFLNAFEKTSYLRRERLVRILTRFIKKKLNNNHKEAPKDG